MQIIRGLVRGLSAFLLCMGLYACGGGGDEPVASGQPMTSRAVTANIAPSAVASPSPVTGGDVLGALLAGMVPGPATPASSGVTLTYALQPNVKVLSTAESATITGFANNGATLVLAASSPVTPNLVFIHNGSAYKATAVSTSGGQTLATVVVPTLHEVFNNFQAIGTIDVARLTGQTGGGATAADARSISPAFGTGVSLHQDVPISAGKVTGQLGVDITGSLAVNIDFGADGTFKTALAQLTGNVVVDGSLTLTQKIPATKLAGQVFDPPCINFIITAGPVPIPSAICMPISVAVNLSADLSGTLPVHYAQTYVAGVAYPASSNATQTDAKPMEVKPSPNYNLSDFLPCLTYATTLSNELKVEPQLNLLKTFKVVSIPSSFTYAGTLKTRLDPRQTTPLPDFAFQSNIVVNMDGEVGVSVPLPNDAISFSGSLWDKVKQAALSLFAKGVISSINDLATYKVNLYNTTISVSSTPPLPACLVFAPQTVSPAGQNVAVNLDPDSTGDSSIKTKVTVTDSTGTDIPVSTAPSGGTPTAGSFSAKRPGPVTVTVTRTGPDGQSTTQTQTYTFVPSGTYTGSFSGNDSGSAVVQVAANGSMTASAVSSVTGSNISGTGQLQNNGDFTLGFGGTTAGGATFTGSFVPLSGAWTMQGSWSNARAGTRGNFYLSQ